MGFYSTPVRKRSMLTRLWKAFGESDAFVPALSVGVMVGFASSFLWGWISLLAMWFILGSIANLKNEIRKR